MDCQIIAWRSQNFEPPILKSDLSNEVSRISSIGHFDEIRICISEFWDDLISRPRSDSTKTYQKHCPKTLGVRSGDVQKSLQQITPLDFKTPGFQAAKRPVSPSLFRRLHPKTQLWSQVCRKKCGHKSPFACFFRRSCPAKRTRDP